MTETIGAIRRASLRRQVAALEAFRDAMMDAPACDYEEVAKALMPFTDALLHELMELEGGPPYPHPTGALPWWDQGGLLDPLGEAANVRLPAREPTP